MVFVELERASDICRIERPVAMQFFVLREYFSEIRILINEMIGLIGLCQERKPPNAKLRSKKQNAK